MKISNSKKELARIISENGGWPDGAESAAQCSGGSISFWHDVATKQRGEEWCGSYLGACDDIRFTGVKLENWHQTILSRAEYFHLYPAPDADGWIEWKGGECPVGRGTLVDVKYADNTINCGVSALTNSAHEDHVFGTCGSMTAANWGAGLPMSGIIAYRLHKPEQAKPEFCESVIRTIPEPEAKPTIEQLAADYCNAKDYAERKQQEADAAKADVDAKLKALELAGEALGLLVSPITEKQESGLVITDWRQLKVGDEVEYLGGLLDYMIGRIGVVERIDQLDDRRPIKLSSRYIRGDHEAWPNKWRFISRP